MLFASISGFLKPDLPLASSIYLGFILIKLITFLIWFMYLVRLSVAYSSGIAHNYYNTILIYYSRNPLNKRFI